MGDAFALENFAPAETVTFRLRKHADHVFEVDADPDTGDVALMLRIEEQMREADTEAATVAAAEEGKQLLLRMIRERQPEITEIKAGMQEVLIVFSLIVRGASVAAAVAEAILAPTAGDGSEERSNSGEAAPKVDGEPGEAAAPLASENGSPESSSDSESETDGLLATGTA